MIRKTILALLSGALMAAPAAGIPFSRVENRGGQPWMLKMGGYVAGTIHIREAGGRAEQAVLKTEGESFRLEAGRTVEVAILPNRNGLALQVSFSALEGGAPGASIFVSQGSPKYGPTININDSQKVHVDKAFYGKHKDGAFVRID